MIILRFFTYPKNYEGNQQSYSTRWIYIPKDLDEEKKCWWWEQAGTIIQRKMKILM